MQLQLIFLIVSKCSITVSCCGSQLELLNALVITSLNGDDIHSLNKIGLVFLKNEHALLHPVNTWKNGNARLIESSRTSKVLLINIVLQLLQVQNITHSSTPCRIVLNCVIQHVKMAMTSLSAVLTLHTNGLDFHISSHNVRNVSNHPIVRFLV